MDKEPHYLNQPQVLYDSVPIPTTIWNENYRILDCNKALVDFFGVPNKKEALERFYEFSPEYQPCGTSSVEKVTQIIDQVLGEGVSLKLRWTHLVKGEDVPIELTVGRVSVGDTFICACYAVDMRPMLEALKEAEETEEYWRHINDVNPIGITYWDDLDSFPKLVDCNTGVLKLVGADSKEDFLNNMLTVYCPEQQPNGMTTIEMALNVAKNAFELGHYPHEWMFQTRDGKPIPIESTAVSFPYKGKVMGACFFQDLRPIMAAMERERELELKLRESEFNERLQMVFDSSPFMIECWDKNYNPIDCNQPVLKQYGFSSKEEYCECLMKTLLGVHEGNIFRDKWNINLQHIFETGGGRFEYLDTKPNGESVFLEVEGIRMEMGGETVVITFSNDITALRQAQEERQRMEIAEEANRAKTRFLARMSHEIRTPITSVLGISEIQLHDPNLPPHIESAFAKIYDSGNLLLGIVNDILDFSKIESGKMPLVNDEYELASLVSDATQLHLVYLEHKNIQFNTHIDSHLPRILIGDQLRIRQIMNNLLSNAFKYTEAGCVTLSMTYEDKQADRATLVISVKDTGRGLSAEQLEELKSGNEYLRFHEHKNGIENGTGLGISIVNSLIQMMGGKIDFSSEVGEGTVVTIRIPQKISGFEVLGDDIAESLQNYDVNTGAASKKFKFVPEPMPYGSVLVVDDSDANLFVAQGLLEFYALKIDTCDNGQAAVERIKMGNVYDIVFLDHMMPGMNGMDAMNIMREMGYNHPIVALTANALVGQAEEFIQAGFDDFISKPIQIKLLNDVLCKYIQDKQPPEVIEDAQRGVKTNAKLEIDGFLGSEELSSRLRTEFAKNHKNTFSDFEIALATEDISKAHRIAHTLKSVSSLIQEAELVKITTDIELVLAKGERPTKNQMSAFENTLTQVLGGIKIQVNKEDFCGGNFDKDKVTSLFDTLTHNLKNLNADSTDYVDELRKLPQTAILVKQIEDFNFRAALQSLETLKEILL